MGLVTAATAFQGAPVTVLATETLTTQAGFSN